MTGYLTTISHIEPYTLGDSKAGILAAGVGGYGGADINGLTCRANNWTRLRPRRVIVITHWQEWWKHGYEPKPGKRVPRKPIRELTLAQVQNLRSINGHRTILTAEQAIDIAGGAKVIPCLEMKPATWPKSAVKALIDHAEAAGVPLVFMTIQSYGDTERARRKWETGAVKRLKLVHSLKGNTMLLWRQPVDWTRWEKILTAVKGPHRGRGNVVISSTLIRRLRRQAGWPL